MVILADYSRKSIEESCDGATVPVCCHVDISSDPKFDFEVDVRSGRADFGSLIGVDDSVLGDRIGLVLRIRKWLQGKREDGILGFSW